MQFVVSRGLAPRPRDQQTVALIRRESSVLRGVSDLALRQRAFDFRESIVRQVHGTMPQESVVTGGALVVEAVRRTTGVELYDVQLLAGMALASGAVAEMQTGEGKTFAATMPAFLWALWGRGVHVMTVNAYLAERDWRLLSPAFELLGMTVGLLRPNDSVGEKRRSYRADVTYGAGYEFGFDYLRDQCRLLDGRHRLGEAYLGRLQGRRTDESRYETVQRGQAFALVDEIDSVLMDEATTPLVLAEARACPPRDTSLYGAAQDVANWLAEGFDYVIGHGTRSIEVTAAGHRKCEQAYAEGRVSIADLRRPWWQYVQQALQAERMFAKDVDYVVRDGRILLVDKTTGRVFSNRSWSEGLRQAIEMKERVEVTEETVAVARISRQRYIRLYDGLAGMTGTATSCEHELWHLYRLPVVVIPARLASRRRVLPTCFAPDKTKKWAMVADGAAAVHQTGRPVLVGTRTIEASASMASEFRRRGIPHEVLNGTQDAPEAQVIAGAGQRGAVTIATNMAGRGTDIRLGAGVDALGGLHVVVTEPHDSRRIDRQLIGRAARQGDPGSCRAFVAPDDSLIVRHAPSLGRRMGRMARSRGDDSPELSRAIASVQQRVERQEYAERRQLFARDRWLEEMLEKLDT